MENQITNSNVISTKDWLITLVITAIPIVGFIMLFVWAFGGGTNPNKANWAKAGLLLFLILGLLGIMIPLFFGLSLLSLSGK